MQFYGLQFLTRSTADIVPQVHVQAGAVAGFPPARRIAWYHTPVVALRANGDLDRLLLRQNLPCLILVVGQFAYIFLHWACQRAIVVHYTINF